MPEHLNIWTQIRIIQTFNSTMLLSLSWPKEINRILYLTSKSTMLLFISSPNEVKKILYISIKDLHPNLGVICESNHLELDIAVFIPARRDNHIKDIVLILALPNSSYINLSQDKSYYVQPLKTSTGSLINTLFKDKV